MYTKVNVLFRECLPKVIRTLESNFLYTQQDAYEILTKIFDDIIPEEIAKLFFIESARRRRCSNNSECKVTYFWILMISDVIMSLF